MALSLLALPQGCAIELGLFSKGRPFYGTVIDAETKEPIEGAVVAVLWSRRPFIRMDGPEYHARADEVLTDANGRFWVRSDPGSDLNPFYALKREPEVIIFKAGYGPFWEAHRTPRYKTLPDGREILMSIPEMHEALRNGAIVELPRLNKRDLLNFQSLSSLAIDAPADEVPQTTRQLEEVRHLVEAK